MFEPPQIQHYMEGRTVHALGDYCVGGIFTLNCILGVSSPFADSASPHGSPYFICSL